MVAMIRTFYSTTLLRRDLGQRCESIASSVDDASQTRTDWLKDECIAGFSAGSLRAHSDIPGGHHDVVRPEVGFSEPPRKRRIRFLYRPKDLGESLEPKLIDEPLLIVRTVRRAGPHQCRL